MQILDATTKFKCIWKFLRKNIWQELLLKYINLWNYNNTTFDMPLIKVYMIYLHLVSKD